MWTVHFLKKIFITKELLASDNIMTQLTLITSICMSDVAESRIQIIKPSYSQSVRKNKTNTEHKVFVIFEFYNKINKI